MKMYADMLHRNTFYQRLLSACRKAPLDNRYMMPRQLRSIRHIPLTKHGTFNTEVTKQKRTTTIELSLKSHPQELIFDADCYYYQACFLCWNKSKKEATHHRQLSDWIFVKDLLPEFEFTFPQPANATQWLLCLRIILCVNKKRIENFRAEGMQIVDVGSFDKKEAAMIKESEVFIKPAIKKAPAAEEVRVKPKRSHLKI